MVIFAAMKSEFYSVRMHAERDGAHLSGAERLVWQEQVQPVVAEMLQRAVDHDPASLQVSVDAVIAETILRGPMPNLTEVPVVDYLAGRDRAGQALVAAGVAADVALTAIETIAAGAGPDGQNMRGAMLIDARSGERLEPVRSRGVRASRMDIDPELEEALTKRLVSQGLIHHRTREALILSAKVLAAPSVIAELCWSDDPDYTAGYVSAPGFGYLRIPQMKEAGDGHGGRAFFFMPGVNLASTIRFLEETPFLVNQIGLIGSSSGKKK